MSDETLTSRTDVFWGVDLSTRAVSIGWVTADASSRGVATAVWNGSLLGAERLHAARPSIIETARSLAREHPPVFVYVEQPSGGKRALTLVYMAGVVQEAIHDVLMERWGQAVQINTVPPSTWKKKVLGRGDFKKPGRDDDFEYQAMIWCRENRIRVADDNEADAVCIAEHARLSVTFA